MFRLLIALGVAAVLLPVEVLTDKNTQANITENEATPPKITTYDLFSAAQTLYFDVTSFCYRNEEACITGKSIASNAITKIRSNLDSLSNDDITISDLERTEIDLLKTSTIKK